MREYYSVSRRIFLVLLAIFLVLMCLICIIPFLHVIALSFSHKIPAMQGKIVLWPLDFNDGTKQIFFGFSLKSYLFVFERSQFWRALFVSAERVVLSGFLTMFVTIITAYPLSKPTSEFRGRTVYVWLFAITMLVSGGLIPWYMIIQGLGMLDSIWALVIPGCAPAFSFLLLLNFFRGLPKSLEESALLDGASHWRILWRIYVPLSLPAIATLVLFTVVGSWNAWFDGLILMTRPGNYPMQSYMYTLISAANIEVMTRPKAKLLQFVNDQTVKSAQVVIGALPMLLLYPFLQRYFMMGMILGSVKE